MNVSPGQLVCSKEDQMTQIRAPMTSGYHLNEVVERFSMKPWQRLFLAYTIAKSVWQYYNSSWMTTVWTLEDIYFLQEKTSDRGEAVFCKPHLSVEFEETEVGNLEHRKRKTGQTQSTDFAFHKYPIVLGLAIMLLEIGKGSLYHVQRHSQWNANTINALYGKSIMDFGTDSDVNEWMHGCDFPDYKTAVRNCLDPGLFDSAAFVIGEPSQNFESRRSILYREVVHKLEKLLERTRWLEDVDQKLDLIPFRPASDTRLHNQISPRSTLNSRPLGYIKTAATEAEERMTGSR